MARNVAIVVIVAFFGLMTLCDSYVVEDHETNSRQKRASSLDVRNCQVIPYYYPPTTFFSDTRLTELRRQMGLFKYEYVGYIIPGYDAHGSEYLADPDKRIYYMSGFNGTGGFAIVTRDPVKAAVWTDRQFQLLAQQQLDCNWEIMILDDPDYLTPWEWLIRDDIIDPDVYEDKRGAGLAPGAKVGYDPLLMPYEDWWELSETNRLEPRSMNLLTNPEDENLVDLTWKQLQGVKDPYPGKKLLVHDENLYTGYTWKEKIYQTLPTSSNPNNFKNVRELMSERDSDMLVITALDEIAWLFNIRGEDVPYNPLFISYAIIGLSYINLYLYDANSRLDKQKYPEVRLHLDLDSSQCQGASNVPTCITNKDASAFTYDLETPNQLIFSQKIWFSNTTNYFVYNTIMNKVNSDNKRYIFEPSPILLMKAVKNEKELDVMKKAAVIDAVNMIEMATWMNGLLQDMTDPKAGNGDTLNEYMTTERLETIRKVQNTYMYPSYETIAAVGPNSADYYYYPKETEKTAIPTGKMFLYDIGGQYREGTTTQARTFFFAKEDSIPKGYKIEQPTKLQREIYTRVLLGHIDLANATFRTNVYGRDLDTHARQYLWDEGLDYSHATGYGVGQFLTVHEGPVFIGDYRLTQSFYENMTLSNGPGYYYLDPDGNNENDFGVRLTSVMRVKRQTTARTQMDDEEYYEFEMLTLIPFETRLINFEFFTRKQIEWFNEYNLRIRDELGGKLSGNARDYMMARTRKQKYKWDYVGGAPSVSMTTTAILIATCALFTQILSL